MLDRNSPIPLYHQLSQAILREIRDGSLQEGDRIPSEHELVARHSIGRPTVRQAIDALVRRGLLVRRRGSGTYVAPKPERLSLFSLAGTSASFLDTGRTPEVAVLEQPKRTMVPTADEGNPLAGQEAFRLSRLSRAEGAPVLVEDIYLLAELFPGLETINMIDRSLSQLVEERYNLTLSGGEQHFAIAYPDERLSRLLSVPRSTPILSVDRFLHFGSAKNAVFARLFCRTDRFVFTQTLGGHPHA